MPQYDEKKATQVAAFLLKLNGGKMDFLKFTKIMYNIERESLRRWSYTITNSKICSMKMGQVLSDTYNNTKNKNNGKNSYWDLFIKTSNDRKSISLKKDCSIGKLSEAEMELISEIFQRDNLKTGSQLVNEHHDYPEYIKTESSITTDYRKLLIALGKTKEQINTFETDMQGIVYLEQMAK